MIKPRFISLFTMSSWLFESKLKRHNNNNNNNRHWSSKSYKQLIETLMLCVDAWYHVISHVTWSKMLKKITTFFKNNNFFCFNRNIKIRAPKSVTVNTTVILIPLERSHPSTFHAVEKHWESTFTGSHLFVLAL